MKSLKIITIIFIILFSMFEFGAFTICILVSLSRANNFMTVTDVNYSFFNLLLSCSILQMPAFILATAVFFSQKSIKVPAIMLIVALISIICSSITLYGVL